MVGRFSFLLTIVLCCSVSVAEEAVEIPLSEVWALNMPRTHSLNLEPLGPQSKMVSKQGELVNAVYLSLVARVNEPQLGPAFVVKGSGAEALKNLKAAIATNSQVPPSFTPEEEISLVFFAIGRHEEVHLVRVVRTEADVRVKYKFVPYLIGPQTTYHFAIIPLGKFPKGLVKVDLQRVPIKKGTTVSVYETPTKKEVKRIVCEPVEFTVE